jgi:hypothetical protein
MSLSLEQLDAEQTRLNGIVASFAALLKNGALQAPQTTSEPLPEANAQASVAAATVTEAEIIQVPQPTWKTPAHKEIDPFDSEYDAVMAQCRDPYPSVPEEMKALPQWLTWGGNVEAGKQPFQSGTKIPASTTTPAHLVSYRVAVDNIHNGQGYPHLGFVPTDDIIGLDIDSCRNPLTGELQPWADGLLKLIPDTYTEITPSKGGLRSWVKIPKLQHKVTFKIDSPGTIPKKNPQVETLVLNYGTITGEQFGQTCHLAEVSEEQWESISKYLRGLAPMDKAAPSAEVKTGQVFEGGRNNYLAERLGTIHQAGVVMPELLAVAKQINQKFCNPPLDDKEVRTISESINRYEITPGGVGSVLIGGNVAGSNPAQTGSAPVDRPMEVEPINEADAVVNSLDYLPSTVLASTRLQDIFRDFADHEWPLTLALPALVTAASVVVPPMPRRDGLVVGDDSMVNLYTALIADVHAGKSQVTNWAATAIGIFEPPIGQHYFEGKWGSAEQMLRSLQRKQSVFTSKAVLITPDEWAHLFSKAAIPDASFPTVLTTSFYRRNQIFTLGGSDGGKEYALNLAMSFIGGIVEDQFDTVFGANSIGGLYDRFLFGRAPDNFKWSYRPCPFEQKKYWADWNMKPVRIDESGRASRDLNVTSKQRPRCVEKQTTYFSVKSLEQFG